MQQQSRLLTLKCNIGFYFFVVVFVVFLTQFLCHRTSVGLGCLLLPMGPTGLIGQMQSGFNMYFFFWCVDFDLPTSKCCFYLGLGQVQFAALQGN